MILSRRNLLKTLGTAAGAVAATSVFGSPLWFVRRIEADARTADLVARASDSDEFNALADAAFDQARVLGCPYADIEIHRCRLLSCLPGVTMNNFASVTESESSYIDVRVLHSGAWGQAASQRFGMEESLSFKKVEASRLTARAVVTARANAAKSERPVVFAPLPNSNCWATPRQNDQFAALIRDQLVRVQEENAVKGMRNVNSRVMLRSEEKFFASTKASCTRTASISVA
jgi:predicted Zn-dependent protease